MSKSFIILSCILVISHLGKISHAFDDVPAKSKNDELSNLYEEPIVNSEETDTNRKMGSMALLILLKKSDEDRMSLEEKNQESKKQTNGGQKTKRCMAWELLRKPRLTTMTNDAQKNMSGCAESFVNDSLQHLKDGKAYYRLASRRDTDNILKSLLKSKSSKREDNDPIILKSQEPDGISLVSRGLKEPSIQRTKKYICYCIEDNCETKKPMQSSRSNAMRTIVGRNNLARNSYSTNEDNQRISSLIAPGQQDVGAPHNLHCPPGAVLVEESDYSEGSDQIHHSHKRRPVKKCSSIIMPCESAAELIGQPTRINIPLAGNRKLNRRIYKVDRTLPYAQKLRSLFEPYDTPSGVPCHEKGSPPNSVSDVQDYYYNNQKVIDRYAQVPMARNFAHARPYVLNPQYSQYRQYSESLVGDSQIPLQPANQPHNGYQEPSKITGVYEKQHDKSTIGSQWGKGIYAATDLPSRKINKWNYPSKARDSVKIGKIYSQEMEADKAHTEVGEKKLTHSGQHPQGRIPTHSEEYADFPRQYPSGQPIDMKNQPSYNLPQPTISNDKIISSTDKTPTYFEDGGNFLDPESLIHYSKYSVPTANPGESETEDHYDVIEEAREDEVQKMSSIGSVSKFPQVASTSISSPQSLQYTIKQAGKDIGLSLSDDTLEVIAGHVSSPDDSSSRYETSEDQYSGNIFHQGHDQNLDEVTEYYTRPTEHKEITKPHSIYGSVSHDEKHLESSINPQTIFMKMKEPWPNYVTTITTENSQENRFQELGGITTVYPVIDPSSWPDEITETNIKNNQGENAFSSVLDNYFSTQKNSNLRYKGSHQLTNNDWTTEKLYTPFFESNKPTIERGNSAEQQTDYLQKSIRPSGNQYATLDIQDFPSNNIKSANHHLLGKVVDEEVGVANRPNTPSVSSINNLKPDIRHHNDDVEKWSQEESTLNDAVVTETHSYEEDNDNFTPMPETISGDMSHLYPDTNDEENNLKKNYYETVNPQSKDDITGISEDGFDNLDTTYPSTPMSVNHYFRNPVTFSDIFKSENVVHDKSSTDHRSDYYSTNQYLHDTPKTLLRNPVKDNGKSNPVFDQNEPTPTMSTLKKPLAAASKKKEKFMTISKQLFDKTDELQRMIPHDTVGDSPRKENSSTEIENNVSRMQPKYITGSSGKAESTSNADNEQNTLRVEIPSNNHKITQPSYFETEVSKFKEYTPSDVGRDALTHMLSTDDKETDSGSKQLTTVDDRIGNVQKAINTISATPIATTLDIKNENAIEPVGTQSEEFYDEFMYTKDYSSVEHSRPTEYSLYTWEPTPSTPTGENTPSSGFFSISEDLALPNLKQVLSLSSKNKESTEKPLDSDSTAPIDKTDLLGLFPGAKSTININENYNANEGIEEVSNDNGIPNEVQSYLASTVRKVVQNLISPEANNAYKNAPNIPDIVPTSDQGLLSGSPIFKSLFSSPEVKDMVIDTVKGLISEANGAPEDILSSPLKDQKIESVLNSIVNNLLLGNGPKLSTSMAVDNQKSKSGNLMIVPASLASIEDDVVQNPADEIFNSIQNIIKRPEIGLQGARLPAVQNIIVHAVENVLMKAKKVVDHSLIWKTLSNIIARAGNAGRSILQPLPTLGPLPKIPEKKVPTGSLKNMPIIPVIEHEFKNGRWSEKQTVLGIRKKPLDSELTESTTAALSDDGKLFTSSCNHKTSIMNANNLEVTANTADYALPGESEGKEDESTQDTPNSIQDSVEVNDYDIASIIDSVQATATKQNIEQKADPQNAPIEYYSPNDRILTYIKNHQIPVEKTNTEANEFSTIDSLVEFKHPTASNSNELPVPQVESSQSEESGEQIDFEDQSTTQILHHKVTKIPKYDVLAQEATTSTRGLFGAAKSYKSQRMHENIKGSTNFENPKADPTYFGKLSSDGGNPRVDKISDLTNTNLFYIGDGVKIPLTIRRMSDGSYALSISDKICETFINRKCPCCVPNEGDIVEESRQPNVLEGSEVEISTKTSSGDSGSFGSTESSKYENESKRRYVRSTSGSDLITTKILPVRSFVKKYNMTLNFVEDHNPKQPLGIDEKQSQGVSNTKTSKRLGSFRDTKITNPFDNNNQIRRDDSEEQSRIIDDSSEVISKELNFIRRPEISSDKDVSSFIDNLLNIRDVPEYKRTETVINAINGLINSASVTNLIPIGHQNMIEFVDKDLTEDQGQWEDSLVHDIQDVRNKIGGYGYQKDNPILERIRFIKENKHGHGQYKYQQNIDHRTRNKMIVLKTVLHWLKEVLLEANRNNKN